MELEQYAIMARAEEDHWWYRGMRAITDRMLDRVYPQRRDLLILDAGCGTGKNAEYFASRGQVIGLDFSAEAIRLSRQRDVARLVRASVDAVPIRSATVDLVTSFEVLYHLDVRSEAAAVSEFARVLRPGGYLLLRLPAYDWLRSAHDRAVHTRHRFTRPEARRLVTAAGLDIVAASYANSLLFPAVAAARLAERVVKPSATAEPLDHPPSPVINTTLTRLLAAEGGLAAGPGLPFGLSVLVLARKRDAANAAARE